eukprot:149936-Pelagomonas_calceolata.AAC.15
MAFPVSCPWRLTVVAAPGRSSDMAFGLTTLWAVVNLLAFQGAAVLELKGRNFACGAIAATLDAAAAPPGQRSHQWQQRTAGT